MNPPVEAPRSSAVCPRDIQLKMAQGVFEFEAAAADVPFGGSESLSRPRDGLCRWVFGRVDY